MAKKKSGKSAPKKKEAVPEAEDLIQELTLEERQMFALMEGFSKLLDETYKEGMTFYDVATVQRFINTFLMDFIEEMHDTEVTELVDELIDLNTVPVVEKKATGPKKAKKSAK